MRVLNKIKTFFSKPKGISAEDYAALVAKKVFTEQENLYEKTLRDQFAGSAINAIIVGNNADGSALGLGAAKDAYDIADVMLAARNIKD